MLESPKKTLVVGLVACVVTVFMYVRAGAEELSAGLMFQPQSLKHVGIHDLRESEPSLTGAEVTIALICRSATYVNGKPQGDYRPNIEHNCFEGKQLIFHDKGELGTGISPHSTAICSILLGEDRNGFNPQSGKFHYQGVTPEAKAEIYEFWDFVINNVFPGLPPEADIVTASIGSQFEYWWTWGIESLAEQYGLIVVAGIGNGLDVHDPPLYPGAGANVIGVGVVDSVNSESLVTNLAHFGLAYPDHSSFGPTLDGRSKPDIVAPGNCLAADDNEPNRYEASGDWSSFSTPIVAGAVGLLVQKAKQEAELSAAVSADSGNCVIKAIVMNSATKLPYWHKGRLEKEDDHVAPLDYIQGAGMLNAAGAYEHLTAGTHGPGEVPTTGWDLNYLDKGKQSENVYRITLTEPAGKLITATAVWNKHYNSFYPFAPAPDKDVDLRLELWGVDPNDPANQHLLDYSDSAVDNVEHIYHPADANYTHYEIIVSYSAADDVNQTGAEQRYGLAWNVADVPESDNIFWYDLNADGIVNELDLVALLDNWLTYTRMPGSYFLGDSNTDGVFDANDVRILIDHRNLKAEWRTE